MFKTFLLMLLFLIGSNQAWAEGKTTFYHYDLLGSPVATTDEQGNVVWREEYSPWGEKLLKEDADHDNVRDYTGHVHDKETGLTYMQARYLDPDIGRFMGIDPVGFKESNPIMFNRYAYANNNPFKFTDPNGEDAKIVHNKNGSISFDFAVKFYGEGATPENINKIAKDVSDTLNGTYTVNGKDTKVDFKLSPTNSFFAPNKIELRNGPTKRKDGASFVSNSRRGQWNVKDKYFFSHHKAAHEVMHLAGVKDQYSERKIKGKRVTFAKPGYRNKLMGEVKPISKLSDKSLESALESKVNENDQNDKY